MLQTIKRGFIRLLGMLAAGLMILIALNGAYADAADQPRQSATQSRCASQLHETPASGDPGRQAFPDGVCYLGECAIDQSSRVTAYSSTSE